MPLEIMENMSKAVADKADIGLITCKVTEEELNNLSRIASLDFIPNQVTDVYKVRRGRWVDVRVWSRMDLGTCRKEDLFITDGSYHPIQDFSIIFHNSKLYNNKIEINNYIKEINNKEIILEEKEEKKITKADWADLL